MSDIKFHLYCQANFNIKYVLSFLIQASSAVQTKTRRMVDGLPPRGSAKLTFAL